MRAYAEGRDGDDLITVDGRSWIMGNEGDDTLVGGSGTDSLNEL